MKQKVHFKAFENTYLLRERFSKYFANPTWLNFFETSTQPNRLSSSLNQIAAEKMSKLQKIHIINATVARL